MTIQAFECPNKSNHTKSPDGYTDHIDWADRMSVKHVQSKCSGCGFYVIWTPKVKA